VRLSTLVRLVTSLQFIAKRNSVRNFILASETTRGFNASFKVSWSQGGEDLALLSLFSNIEIGTYIDIGAHHPSRYSNTRHLYQRGWRGVNIDADEDLMPIFLSERSEDINICAAVGSEPHYVLNVFDEKLVSTVDPNRVDFEISIGRTKVRERTVKGITLRSIIDQYFPHQRVSLLSIDIEGSDFDALESIGFDTLEKSRYPKYLLLETFPPLGRALEMPAVKLAESKGYIPLLVLPLSTILRAPDID
jgi:FkbM family methyltransferase